MVTYYRNYTVALQTTCLIRAISPHPFRVSFFLIILELEKKTCVSVAVVTVSLMCICVTPLRSEYEAVDKMQHIPLQTAVFMCIIYSTDLVTATTK